MTYHNNSKTFFIIFLDEPTNSLDINVRKMLYDILEKLNKEGLNKPRWSLLARSAQYDARISHLRRYLFSTSSDVHDELLHIMEVMDKMK